jgi:exopolysaccharide production protein ExoQ
MPPQIALFLCVLLILFLFRSESKRECKVSRAIWIPLIWIMAIGSRPIGFWFGLGGATTIAEAESAYLSGSPIDRTLFIILIISGVFVLSRRQIHWSRLIRKNTALFLWLLYCGISIVWSDYPFVAFKRWIMATGYFVMVLLLLTDASPIEAVKSIFRRYSYAFIPLSIVLIKYYPHLGVIYGPWSGAPEYAGVTQTKNLLGQLCVISGLFFLWQFLSIRRQKPLSDNRRDLLVTIFFLFMTAWLLLKASSATCFVSVITSICILTGLSDRKSLRTLGLLLLVGIPIAMILEYSLNITEILISHLGRDATFSGRTELWSDLLTGPTNRLIGSGFESFWLGDTAHALWEKYWWRPNQAHNGYIEIYLNLGLTGLFLGAALIISTVQTIRNAPLHEFALRRFQIAYFVIFLLTNITEDVFKGVMWFFFLLIAIDFSPSHLPQDRTTEMPS